METDGMEEAISGQLRVLVTAASQVGQSLSRWQEEQSRKAQVLDEQRARELQSRIEAEQRMARLELARSSRSDWWERATPEQIAYTYQVAVAWKDHDPEAARAEHHMRNELHTRYGIDVDNTGADPEAVREAVIAAQNNLDVRKEQDEAERERAEAHQLVNAATAEEQQARDHEVDTDRPPASADVEFHERNAAQLHHEVELAYDTVERREHTAAELKAQGIDPQAIDARMQADVSQAKPATDAVKNTPGHAAKARKQSARFNRHRSKEGLSR